MSRRAGARRRTAPAAPAADGTDAAGGAVSPRQQCPCGSGRRYKNCHGAGDVVVARPFQGLVGECDWIALRELVPSATAPLRLASPVDRQVLLATVLPLALPAIVRADGRVLLGLQVHARSGDVSRDLAHALEQALAAEPGTMVSGGGLPGRVRGCRTCWTRPRRCGPRCTATSASGWRTTPPTVPPRCRRRWSGPTPR